jgi:flavin reductase (DIM6/NTAB) family NADH-FMN oxidoreductase RutF
MQIDPKTHSHAVNYKVLTNVVVPRPIAWVTSLNSNDVVNLAPFSFFNAVSGTPKDTARNILQRRDFVVNLVTEELLQAMNISAADFLPDESEMTAAGLHAAASVHIATPRLAESLVSLECKLFQSLPLGENTLVIGEVVMMHVADHLMGPRHHVENFAPIGRLGSPSLYCRTTDRFDLPRLSYQDFRKTQPR